MMAVHPVASTSARPQTFNINRPLPQTFAFYPNEVIRFLPKITQRKF